MTYNINDEAKTLNIFLPLGWQWNMQLPRDKYMIVSSKPIALFIFIFTDYYIMFSIHV